MDLSEKHSSRTLEVTRGGVRGVKRVTIDTNLYGISGGQALKMTPLPLVLGLEYQSTILKDDVYAKMHNCLSLATIQVCWSIHNHLLQRSV